MVDMKTKENELLNFIIKHFDSNFKMEPIDIDILDSLENGKEKGLQALYNVLDSDKFMEYANEKDIGYLFSNTYGYKLIIYKLEKSIKLEDFFDGTFREIKETKKGCSKNGMKYIYEYASELDEFSPCGDALYILNESENIKNIKDYLRTKKTPYSYRSEYINIGVIDVGNVEKIFKELLDI